MLFEGAQAWCRQGDAPFGTLGLGREGGQAAGVGALEGASDACGSAGEVEVFSAQAAAGIDFIREELGRAVTEYPSLARNQHVCALAQEAGLKIPET
jgi:hypothetical protein